MENEENKLLNLLRDSEQTTNVFLRAAEQLIASSGVTPEIVTVALARATAIMAKTVDIEEGTPPMTLGVLRNIVDTCYYIENQQSLEDIRKLFEATGNLPAPSILPPDEEAQIRSRVLPGAYSFKYTPIESFSVTNKTVTNKAVTKKPRTKESASEIARRAGFEPLSPEEAQANIDREVSSIIGWTPEQKELNREELNQKEQEDED